VVSRLGEVGSKPAPADQEARERDERGVGLDRALVAGREPAEAVQQREGLLDRPAVAAEAGAVGGTAPGDPDPDAAAADGAALGTWPS